MGLFNIALGLFNIWIGLLTDPPFTFSLLVGGFLIGMGLLMEIERIVRANR